VEWTRLWQIGQIHKKEKSKKTTKKAGGKMQVKRNGKMAGHLPGKCVI
jgi:hypothetical protein